MKVRISYQEHTRREAEFEVASIAEAEAAWAMQYDSVLVDQIEDTSIEVDGGIDWDSAEFKEIG